MKAWAKSFYLSAAWEKTRAAYLMSQDYICERCGQPAKIVHHKRWLNRENINDIKKSPEAETYIALSKNYAAVIKQLTELVPAAKRKTSRLAALREE